MKKSQTLTYLIDFIDSGYTNIDLIKQASSTHNSLKIYGCLNEQQLNNIIQRIPAKSTPKEIFNYLANHQPSINITIEVYDNVVEQIRNDMEQYFKYNGYKMINAFGSQEDWINHFYMKYYYFVKFYRDRWFFPETLAKKTKVVKTYKSYSDFLNLARKSITEERKVQARKAAENPEASINKFSIDKPLYQNNEKMTILDVTTNDSYFVEDQNAKTITRKIIDMATEYENGKYAKKITDMLMTGECRGHKTEVTLLKIFAYKSGVVTPKSLKFISKLSKNYKDKFQISIALLNKQMRDLGLKK